MTVEQCWGKHSAVGEVVLEANGWHTDWEMEQAEAKGYNQGNADGMKYAREKVLDDNLITEIIGTLTITEGFVPTAIRSEVMRLREKLAAELRQQGEW